MQGTVWVPIKENDIIQLKDEYSVEAIRNNHVKAEPEISKSLSFKIHLCYLENDNLGGSSF